MPTYSYQCNACQHKFDKFQYMSEEPLKTCPQCHQDSLKRLIGTGAGFIFKGSGFYITDYRSQNYQEKVKSESGSSSGSEASTTSTSAATAGTTTSTTSSTDT